MTAPRHRHTGPSGPPRFGVSLPLGLAGSALVHVGLWFAAGWYMSTPDVDLQFQLPSEVEFGVTEAVEPPRPKASKKAPSQPQPQSASETAGAGASVGPDAAVASDAGADAATPDAGPPDAGMPEERRDRPDAARLAKKRPSEPSTTDAGAADGGALAMARGDGGAAGGEGEGDTLPPGAQLALRLDMEGIRKSPLGPDVRKLLAALPHWQRILGDSGIDPLDTLDRLLLAHPGTTNEWGWLLASRVIIAGSHKGDPGLAKETVSRLARARGAKAAWQTRYGVPVAPWHDRSPTDRVLARIGAHHFAVTRPEDLPRLLAVAEARKRQHTDGGRAAPDPDTWAEALLSMGEGKLLSLELEGGRRFVRGGQVEAWPVRAQASVRTTDPEQGPVRVRIQASGEFDSPDQAQKALRFWDMVRQDYANNLGVRALGMSSPLSQAELEAQGNEVLFETELQLRQVRFALDFVEGSFDRGAMPGARTP